MSDHDTNTCPVCEQGFTTEAEMCKHLFGHADIRGLGLVHETTDACSAAFDEMMSVVPGTFFTKVLSMDTDALRREGVPACQATRTGFVVHKGRVWILPKMTSADGREFIIGFELASDAIQALALIAIDSRLRGTRAATAQQNAPSTDTTQ